MRNNLVTALRKNLILLAVLPTIASAGALDVTWVNPTKYTDNTNLAVADIQQNRVEYGTCTGTAFGTKIGEAISGGAAVAKQIPDVAPGTYCVRVFTTAKNTESAASNVASKVVAQPAPMPPVLTATTTAYTLVKQRDALVMLPVGTVAPDTKCLADRVNDMNAVPRDSVTFTGSVKPEVVFSVCAPS